MNKKNINYSDEYLLRKKKLNLLRVEKNIFSLNFKRKTTSKKLLNKYKYKTKKELKKLKIKASISGRIISRRIMKNSCFITINDCDGNIQIYISKDKFNIKEYREYCKIWDIGDIVGCFGILFKTNTGEISIKSYKNVIITKSIKPIPKKLKNVNISYRRRYLDLLINNKSKKKFILRSKIISNIRIYMEKLGFIEVETPILQNVPGGAIAKPFVTYHNSLNIDIYLRIAPELYLKKLIIGGLEKIFEISKSFRNEGISKFHNPEFTMMEVYIAYSDYLDIMKFVKKLFNMMIKKIIKKNYILYDGKLINLKKDFKICTMQQLICKYCFLDSEDEINNIKNIKKISKKLNLDINDNWSIGKIQYKIFEEIVESKLIKPTFVTSYPIDVSPLAKRNNYNKFVADRFELFIGGMEICNGFSELNDPKEQKERFLKQNNENVNSSFDKEYIKALEYGLPPTGGFGIGIDRLLMLLTNSESIKDVILFPLVKPSDS
ncbi:MAG: lysine--tRNA ligase [Enterobacteriaceae bacterium]